MRSDSSGRFLPRWRGSGRTNRHFLGKAGELLLDRPRPEQLAQHRRPHQSAEDGRHRKGDDIAEFRDGRSCQQNVRAGSRKVITRREHQCLDQRRVLDGQSDGNRGAQECPSTIACETSSRASASQTDRLAPQASTPRSAAAGCGRTPDDRTRSPCNLRLQGRSGRSIRNPGSCCHCREAAPEAGRCRAPHSAAARRRSR